MNKDEILKRNINDCKNNDEYTIRVENKAYRYAFEGIIISSIIAKLLLSLEGLEQTIMFSGIKYPISQIFALPQFICFAIYNTYKYKILHKRINLLLSIITIGTIIEILFDFFPL